MQAKKNMNAAQNIGMIPINTAVLRATLPEVHNVNAKILRMEREGELIRLKRGLFVVHPNVSGKILSLELIANHIYGPSYVSMHTALRYYGLIPERVVQTQSVTIKHTRSFTNELGEFTYQQAAADYFAIGLQMIQQADYSFVMASPEKALCDLIIFTSGLNLRSKREILTFLQDNLRLDMEAFYKMDASIFVACAACGQKRQTLTTIANILQS